MRLWFSVDFFSAAVENTDNLIIPTISLYQVFKRVLQQRGENVAMQAVALMRQGQVVELSAVLALNAVQLSHELKLPMADSLILAMTRRYNATLWTQDADFKGIEKEK